MVAACCVIAMQDTYAQTAPEQDATPADADPDISLLDRVIVSAIPVSGTRVDADHLPCTVQTAPPRKSQARMSPT